MKRLAAIILAFSLSSTVLANGQDLDLDLEITTEEIETPYEVIDLVYQNQESQESAYYESLGESQIESAVSLSQIVNLGKQVWDIVKKGKPVANVEFDYANALPRGIVDVAELNGFSDLQFKSYRISAKNLYGASVYNIVYTMVHQFGGSYDGQGSYLSTVSIIPSSVTVLWGYTVDYKVAKVAAVNVGTAENPVGSLLMDLKFKVSTVLKSHETNTLVQFRGDKAEVTSTRM